MNTKEVERLKQYTFIPLNLNTATEADFMTIPGVGKRMAHEFEEYRPWKTQAAVREGDRQVRERQRGRASLALRRHSVAVFPLSLRDRGCLAGQHGGAPASCRDEQHDRENVVWQPHCRGLHQTPTAA